MAPVELCPHCRFTQLLFEAEGPVLGLPPDRTRSRRIRLGARVGGGLIEVPPAKAQHPAAADVVDEVDPRAELIVFQHCLLVVTQTDLRGQTLEEPHAIGGVEGVVLTRELVLIEPGQLLRGEAGIVDPVPDHLVVEVVVGGVVAAELEAPFEIVIARQLMVPVLSETQDVEDAVVDQHEPLSSGVPGPPNRPTGRDRCAGRRGWSRQRSARRAGPGVRSRRSCCHSGSRHREFLRRPPHRTAACHRPAASRSRRFWLLVRSYPSLPVASQ